MKVAAFWAVVAVIVYVLYLIFASDPISNDLHVTSFRAVEGAESAPWPSGCLVNVEDRTQKIIGLYGLPCAKIQIGDKAAFNHKGDTVFWVNEIPYTVRSAQAK